RWWFALLQFAPLLVCALMLSACSGVGGSGSGDFLTSRRSNIFLKGFFELSPQNANFSQPPVAITAIAPFGGHDAATNPANATFSFPDALAGLEISNGISATVNEILVNYTEVDGTPIL